MTSFSFLEYFDAFELDVNVVNFVYYGKTRFLQKSLCYAKNDAHVRNFVSKNSVLPQSRITFLGWIQID